jgi:hypothetical protein
LAGPRLPKPLKSLSKFLKVSQNSLKKSLKYSLKKLPKLFKTPDSTRTQFLQQKIIGHSTVTNSQADTDKYKAVKRAIDKFLKTCPGAYVCVRACMGVCGCARVWV